MPHYIRQFKKVFCAHLWKPRKLQLAYTGDVALCRNEYIQYFINDQQYENDISDNNFFLYLRLRIWKVLFNNFRLKPNSFCTQKIVLLNLHTKMADMAMLSILGMSTELKILFNCKITSTNFVLHGNM